MIKLLKTWMHCRMTERSGPHVRLSWCSHMWASHRKLSLIVFAFVGGCSPFTFLSSSNIFTESLCHLLIILSRQCHRSMISFERYLWTSEPFSAENKNKLINQILLNNSWSFSSSEFPKHSWIVSSDLQGRCLDDNTICPTTSARA